MREKVRESKYQDFVIKNGCFIGKFEEMYQKISDPWKILEKNKSGLSLNYQMILNCCEHIRSSKTKTLEIGCGYAQISYELYKKKFTVYGTDISKTVIEKSKKKYPELKNNLYVSNFLNFFLYEKIKPDIIILSDISWYVLPELRKFIKWYKNLKSKVYLIHSLTVYKKNEQEYGKNYFYDLKTIKKFFKLDYLCSGYIDDINDGKHAFFISSNK